MSAPNANPPVTFASFVISLGSSALVHLGELQDPASDSTATDLNMARHTIDVLNVLKEKTSGNLDDEEARLIDTLLFELRAKYLAAQKKG